ncbi:regulatory protein RecX [Pseudoalteromonas sp. McH1-7]|uniref:Regulatory protein RecX n=1 Tax=Pseudoalteromonas peptidolytica F12-50-A1 TaxID=1315280 RepID=A0A8I0MUU1_9GAMM|nr:MULTISPECIES: regulatory protein RecX [Pseudoalteromonas]MBE0345584.1 regulatory protein [Pseudoalteromonas peptidolytica F12-50-A1]MDW7547674.1 regulatory protein RecX [Pseudoalteromonas peptidolytica]NLR13521.1 regulatory protein RecX [Pseudoalteromonas peptidolytica]NUZ11251.1 regulatory protein RecX [Pseudoalteromonas sp. McH1-7]RRS06990.1 regulatory protein RecX [Pseudoalteromonas sp. J010]
MDELEVKKLKNYAVWLLSRQEYSQTGLTQKLLQKGATAEVAQQLVSWLVSLDYVNDHRFAESFLNRQIAKGLGAKRILLDAGQKGVSRDTLHALFAEREIDWYMQAAKTYQKKYGVCEQPLEYKEKTKRVRYMSYRGFSFDEIDFAIEAAMNAAEQEAIKGE